MKDRDRINEAATSAGWTVKPYEDDEPYRQDWITSGRTGIDVCYTGDDFRIAEGEWLPEEDSVDGVISWLRAFAAGGR